MNRSTVEGAERDYDLLVMHTMHDDLAARRERINLRPTDLAAMLGVRVETLVAWESGRRAPRGDRRQVWISLLDELERDLLADLLVEHWVRG